jgi:hypothetical protein
VNQKGAKGNLVTVKPINWVYVTVVLLLIGPLSIAVVYSGELYNGYVRTYIAPRIQRQFGFKMERRRMHYRTQALDVFVIKGLNPDGVLAKAGVRNGDVPVGDYHVSDVTFYRELEESRKRAVEIHLVNCAEYEGLLKSGDLDLFDRGHIVTVPRGE